MASIWNMFTTTSWRLLGTRELAYYGGDTNFELRWVTQEESIVLGADIIGMYASNNSFKALISKMFFGMSLLDHNRNVGLLLNPPQEC